MFNKSFQTNFVLKGKLLLKNNYKVLLTTIKSYPEKTHYLAR